MKLVVVVLIVILLGISVVFQYWGDRVSGEKGHSDIAKDSTPNEAPPPVKSAPLPKIDNAKLIAESSGLKYQDVKVGTGSSPKNGQTVVVNYTGWLENGKKFDSSLDSGSPFEFKIGLGQVIKGWDEGVASMKIRGKRILVIPPELGYGASGAGESIPPNSMLIFEVELLGIK